MALTQSHYRFGIDELAENTHGWHAAEDANPAQGVIALDTTFLLRFCVQANATGLNNVDNEFQYRKNGGTWTNITTTSSNVKAVAATALTNGGNCTQRLSGTGTFESSGAGQTEDGTSGGTANDIVASGNSETECGLQLVGADLADDDAIDFRLTRDGGTLLDTYAVTPTLTVLKAMSGSLSQTLGALTSSASGTVKVAGSAAPTLGALTSDADGVVPMEGALAATLVALTSDADGVTNTRGVLAATLGDASLEADGTVSSSGVTGTLSATLGALTSAGEGDVLVLGSAAPALGALTSDADGAVAVTGLAGIVLATDPRAISGTVLVRGSAAPALGALTPSASGKVSLSGAAALLLGALTGYGYSGELFVGHPSALPGPDRTGRRRVDDRRRLALHEVEAEVRRRLNHNASQRLPGPAGGGPGGQ